MPHLQKNKYVKAQKATDIETAYIKFALLVTYSESSIEITVLNEIINLGEELLNHGTVSKVISYNLIRSYDERALHNRHSDFHDKENYPKNIRHSISDYTRVLELLELLSKSSTNVNQVEGYDNFLRRALEGRCECYLEIGSINNAILDSLQLTKTYEDAQAYILRSRCYFCADIPKLAIADANHAIAIAKQEKELSKAIELQKSIREKYKDEQTILNQIHINGNVSESNIIAGNKNNAQNSIKK